MYHWAYIFSCPIGQYQSWLITINIEVNKESLHDNIGKECYRVEVFSELKCGFEILRIHY